MSGWPQGMQKFGLYNSGNGSFLDIVDLTGDGTLFVTMKKGTWDGEILRSDNCYASSRLDRDNIVRLRDALTEFLEERQ